MGRDISVTFPRKSQANDHLTTLVESLGRHQGCSFLVSTCPSLPVSTCGRHKVARFIPSLSSVCSVLLLTRLPGGEGAATVPCAPLQLPAVRLHTLWDLHPASGTPSGGKTPLGSSPLPTLAQMQLDAKCYLVTGPGVTLARDPLGYVLWRSAAYLKYLVGGNQMMGRASSTLGFQDPLNVLLCQSLSSDDCK